MTNNSVNDDQSYLSLPCKSGNTVEEVGTGIIPFASKGAEKTFVYTRYVSTCNKMYGKGGYQPKLQYRQNAEISLEGLRKRNNEIYTEQENVISDDIPSLIRVLGKTNVAQDEGLSRLLDWRTLRRDGQDKISNTSCPFCDLKEADPPLYSIPMDKRIFKVPKETEEQKRLRLLAEKQRQQLAMILGYDKADRKARQQAVRYGNLPLGILTQQHAWENLWCAVSMLQPPRVLMLRSYPGGDHDLPRLKNSQWGVLAAKHFTQKIGVPPWLEYFIAEKRKQEAWEQDMQNKCGEKQVECIKLEEIISKLNQKNIRLKEALNIGNPFVEMKNLEAQLGETEYELSRQTKCLKNTKIQTLADRLIIPVNKALQPVILEEIRRQLFNVNVLLKVASALKIGGLDELVQNIQEQVFFDVLVQLPSVVFSGSQVVPIAKTLERVAKDAPELYQCKYCMMLTISSLFCPITGRRHEQPTLRFGEMEEALPSESESDLDESVVDEETEATKFKPKESLERIQESNKKETDVDEEELLEFDNEGLDSDESSMTTSMDEEDSAEEPDLGLDEKILKMRQQENDIRERRKQLEEEEKKRQEGRDHAVKGKSRSHSPQEDAGVREAGEDNSEICAENDTTSDNRVEQKKKKSRLGNKFESEEKSEKHVLSVAPADEEGEYSSPLQANATRGAGQGRGRHGKISRFRGVMPKQNMSLATRDKLIPDEIIFAAQELMGDHVCRFLAAAAARDFALMHRTTRTLLQSSSLRRFFSETVLQLLTGIEEKFYAWYSVVGVAPIITSEISLLRLLKRSRTANTTAIEEKLHSLRKELGELEYSFKKRAKGSSGGAVLDDNGFATLALKILELEKENSRLRIKANQINKILREKAEQKEKTPAFS